MKKLINKTVMFFSLISFLSINSKISTHEAKSQIRLTFSEELSISANNELIISEIKGLEVDEEENIYILDGKQCKIFIFNKFGRLIRCFGQQGQGPEDMASPTGIQIIGGNELLIEDSQNKKLIFFSREGNFIKTIPLKKLSFLDVKVDSKRNFIARELIMSENKLFWQVAKYDQGLNLIFVIDKKEFENPLIRPFNPFRHQFVYQLDQNDRIIYGKPDKFQIIIFSPDGQILNTINLNYKPEKVSEEDKKEILKKIPESWLNIKDKITFPEYFPAFRDFTIDENGRIFIRKYEKSKTKGHYMYEVINLNGEKLGEFSSHVRPLLWKKGCLYSLEETNEGFPILRRYKVNIT